MLKSLGKFIVIVISFIFCFITLKSEIIIKETDSEILINVRNLTPVIKKIDTNTVLSFDNLQGYLLPITENTDVLSFQFAADNDLFDIKYNIISETTLSGKENFEFEISPDYFLDISNSGFSRGIKLVDIIFNPFRLDIFTDMIYYASEIEIIIKHSGKIERTENINFGIEESFFINVINSKQLQTLINKKKVDKQKNLFPELMSGEWYNPELNYVRIETKKDAFTKIKISDISKIQSEIIGKESKFLNLIHRGKKYPYLILNDDGIISYDDEIIFFGRRPAGDTTWLDSYTNYESFFLCYDENSIGLRFSGMDLSNSSAFPNVNSVEIDSHIEVEKVYSEGSLYLRPSYDGTVAKSFHYDTRTIMGEGWFWDIIAPFNYDRGKHKSTFSHNVLISPSELAGEELTVSLWYRTMQDSIGRENRPTVSTYYDNLLRINDIERKRDSIMGYHYRPIEFKSQTTNFLNGLNKVELEASEVFIETNERTSIDFIKIKGSVKPVAYNDNLEFIGKSDNFRAGLEGFQSSRLLAYDLENNKFTINDATSKGILFRISGNSEGVISGSVGINDSVIYVFQPGLHVLNYNITSNQYAYRHFTGMDNQHNTYINSISAGNAIAILIVSQNNLSGDFSSIRSLGSTEINNYSAGSVLASAFIKSSPAKEEILSSGKAGFTKFLINTSGNSNKFDIALESDNNSKFVVQGFDNIEYNDRIFSVNKSNLRNNNQLNVVFITHKNFLTEAERLAEYRRKTLGTKVEVVDADDVYKEFSYGRKTPHGIKDFLKYSYDKRNITYVLLIGDASWDARNVLDISLSTNWMPTYGYPVSDWWYACLDGDDDVRPELVIGRLPVNTPQQASNYIDKVIEHEETPESPWMKNFLFLVGGYNAREINQFRELIPNYYRDNILGTPLCGTISNVIKDVDGPSTSFQGGEIREQINRGALWTIYIGHAAAEIFDLDGWNVSSLNNKGRYGLLTTISCNTGAFAEPQLIASRNEQYILENDKGFVAATGGSFTGFLGPHNNVSSRMVEALADRSKKMRFIGDLLVYGKAILSPTHFAQLSTLHSFALLGDPLVRARVGTEADIYIPENNIEIKNQNDLSRFTDNDEFVSITGKIFNYGYSVNDNFSLRIIREYLAKSDTLHINYNQLCYFDDFSFSFDIKDMPGRHRITIIADPENKIDELTKENNIFTTHIDVFKEGILNFDPMSYWDLSPEKPRFRIINPFEGEYDFDYDFLITIGSDTSNVVYKGNSASNPGEFVKNENYTDWLPNINLQSGSYWFHSRYINNTNQTWSAFNSIPINANPAFNQNQVNVSIVSSEEFQSGKIDNLMIEEENSKIKLSMKRENIPFKALGIKGNKPNNPEGNPVLDSRANIEAGDVVFVDGMFDLGFNVATIRSSTGELITRYKRFETWGLQTPERDFAENLVPLQLVEFLRDSIRDDEYVIIATCQSSFRLPYLYKMKGVEGNYGSVDSLLYYLGTFGSQIADTLVFDENFNGDQLSFAMMGWRGAKRGTIPEAISFVGDTAFVSGYLTLFSSGGSFTSPKISKSKKWNKIEIDGIYPENGTDVELLVKGINQNGSIDTILTDNNPISTDLNSIDAAKYPELITEVKFLQSKYDINSLLTSPPTTLSSLRINFVPADEIAIAKSKTEFDKKNLLRGEKVNYNTEIVNLSLRNEINSLDYRINVSRSGTENDFRHFNITGLKPNTSQKISHLIETDFLDYFNNVAINIDNDEKLVEFFRFNNNYTLGLNIDRDTTKPYIKLIIDGKNHNYGDFISNMPMFEVELYDNSPLQITDSTTISVRVNGFLHPFQRTIWSEFKSVNDGTNLKAVFRFIPDTLQYDDASIIVYFRDNESNRDTLVTLARLSLINAFVEEVYAYPNPANDLIKFNLNYKAPNHGMKSTLEIYDLNGNIVFETDKELRLGDNTFEWNTRYFGGASMPSGVYVYRIKFKGEFYLEPVYGKFILVK